MKLATMSLGALLFLLSCSTNIYESLVTDTDDTGKMEEAANLIDDQKYDEAVAKLNEVEKDNNEKRFLQVAALLGQSGFNVWQIVIDIIDSGSSSSKITFDRIFDSISGSVFGSGDERDARIAAIGQSITLLDTAPEGQTRATANLNCFLGGVLAVVAVDDGNTAMSGVSSALQSIQDNATGTGDSTEECPGIEDLSTNLDLIASVQTNLSLVLAATSDCSFIDFSGSELNSVEQQIADFVDNGDQGCSENPDCGAGAACQALSLGCVQSVVNDDSSVSGDGTVSSCEIVQNCLGASCF
ncbi:hypothetical protein [Pseudobacteriovorax antillogorgiicola]|uniref:Lipoprotein n=1 Tax=Pseudobacteriovorax antillogorgiicola TaxID=1513793 RepID=A0A1Y6CTT8_9BACT|nr:hypothetical protein [Pseudobacteriovorax antillogorgiicola]TCS45002.1 hypothetical protein EDD56_13039 [Pseudobacteriovorax antillogorgiicola]SMF76482.1 hypothetical protein SAMN06296036_13035 [Pseudobacteriovorax antillogorgiicola]